MGIQHDHSPHRASVRSPRGAVRLCARPAQIVSSLIVWSHRACLLTAQAPRYLLAYLLACLPKLTDLLGPDEYYVLTYADGKYTPSCNAPPPSAPPPPPSTETVVVSLVAAGRHAVRKWARE